MKNRASHVLLICGALFLPLVYVTAQPAAQPAAKHDRPAPRQWEHLALSQEDAKLDAELSAQINRLGREGWELVGVTPITAAGTTSSVVYYFKRPK